MPQKIDSLEKASKKELAQVIYDLKAKYLRPSFNRVQERNS